MRASEQPMVSICIPAYNSEAYILETVKAALDQTWKNLEVLVVDDCSSDRTVEVLEKIDDPRFRLVENEVNLGMTGNWNRCVQLCRGEYIKLIPADDVVYPECVEKSVKALIKYPQVSLVITDTDLIDPSGKKIGAYAHWPVAGAFDGAKIAKASVMLNNFYGNPVCAMFRKTDFIKVGGFDPDIPYILDFDLWLGLSRLGDVMMIREHLNAFRVREDSNTGKMTGKGGKKYTDEHARLVDKHRKLGTYPMNGAERTFSVVWRRLRNYLIAAFIRIKSA